MLWSNLQLGRGSTEPVPQILARIRGDLVAANQKAELRRRRYLDHVSVTRPSDQVITAKTRRRSRPGMRTYKDVDESS